MLELRAALQVGGDRGPVVVPGDVVRDALVDHGFDGEDLPGVEDGGGRARTEVLTIVPMINHSLPWGRDAHRLTD